MLTGNDLKSGLSTNKDAGFVEQEDDIAIEYPLTIMLNGEEFATMVCTPADLEELVVGFLASEGVIRLPDEIESLSISEERGFAYVKTANPQTDAAKLHSKRFIGSCCGKSRQFYLHNDVKTAKTIISRTRITASQCIRLMELLQQSSTYFQLTGGLHNAALCNADGLLLTRTDIGRHNALDKIFGYCLQARIPLADKVLAFSGRVSSEVLLKAAKIGVGIILSKSAPTDLALDLAHDLGITVVGFIRGNQCNVYTHRERIVEE
ncbi:formate dehydrogenase accessory sulfurtransferase FdhD [Brevibacillus dissolubilis]|uniref:formate dehydrogenase accessory sulfurtransferase FdhD n=1 Tax=Brevibacillus dissolubilis TaxID=1844116 RepID=UPI0011179751|nr:formate dehydrogenase accessory sulfurtransferase FdhD [Brevibacillus dissolubilis]